MCFHELQGIAGPSRADALKALAAMGGLPLLGASAVSKAASATSVNEGAPATAFVGGTAFVGDELTVVRDATVVVRGNRIVAVGPSSQVAIPSGAQRIALRGKYVLPGLIDSHVHFFQSGGLFTRPDAIDLRAVRSYTDELAWINAHLPDTFARYLRAGITSVSDVGGPFWNYDVRAQAVRTAVAPRVAAAGPLISSVDRSILSPHGDPPIVRIDNAADARALVHREAERKTDFVKMWWVVGNDHPAAAFKPVAQATSDESKALGLRVAIHALELETARLAAESGTDILVHNVFDTDVDDAFVSLLLERKIILCPTLRVPAGYQTTFAMRPDLSTVDLRLGNPDVAATLFMLQDIPNAETSEQRLARAKVDPVKARAAAMRNLKRLHDAGVTIAAGTDAGNIGTLHASSLYAELETMVDSGLSPKDVLVTATLNGAKHMAREHELGTLAAGKLADIVVLDADPTVDIRNVAAVHLVVKEGRAYRPTDLAPETAEQTVQRAVNAFNAHNATALAGFFAHNGHINELGRTAATPAEIGAYYADAFSKNPGAHAMVTAKRRTGNSFIVEEQLSAYSEADTQHAVATFTMNGTKIAALQTTLSATNPKASSGGGAGEGTT